MKKKNEADLVRRVKKKNDRRAAEQLIEMYYREIYAYVYKQLGNKENTMDITQEIFISMLQSIWSYDHEKASFRTWLYRIATHRIADYFRASRFRKEFSEVSLEYLKWQSTESWDKAGNIDIERDIASRQEAEEILKILREKDILLEEIFRLRFFGEYTFEEIAESLEMPISTVKTKYYGAIRQMRRDMKGGYDYEN